MKGLIHYRISVSKRLVFDSEGEYTKEVQMQAKKTCPYTEKTLYYFNKTDWFYFLEKGVFMECHRVCETLSGNLVTENGFIIIDPCSNREEVKELPHEEWSSYYNSKNDNKFFVAL